MVKSIVNFLSFFTLIIFLSACSSTNSKPLLIAFSADSSAIVFSNIDPAGLLQLKNFSPIDTVFNDLVSVLQSPSEIDTTVKEMPIAGYFKATDSSLVFTPVQPFIKGVDYLVITSLNVRFGSTEKLLKGDLSYGIRPKQKLLTR